MRHEDFNSLEIDDVLVKVMTYVRERTRSAACHWISAFGLKRIQEASGQNWDWAFASADVVGKHMWSQPASDLWGLYQMWSQVSQLYPQPWKSAMAPHMINQPVARYAHPVYFEDKFLGLLLVDRPHASNPVEIAARFKAGVDLAARYIHFAYVHLEAKNDSYIDEVTGLHNQRYLPMALEHEIQRTKREATKFTLLFLDIDYFKMVNDGRGHWVGSKLLLELGRVLKSQVRACDYVFRYGGDEFIVILGNADSSQARVAAERIRKAVENHAFQVDGHNLNLTVSIGLASYPEHAQSAVALIKLADEAMYYGKRKSRNIVFVAS